MLKSAVVKYTRNEGRADILKDAFSILEVPNRIVSLIEFVTFVVMCDLLTQFILLLLILNLHLNSIKEAKMTHYFSFITVHLENESRCMKIEMVATH